MKHVIKELLRESLLKEVNKTELTDDYFIRRVPFLRDNKHKVTTNNEVGAIVQIITTSKEYTDIDVADSDNNIRKINKFSFNLTFEYSISLVSGSPDSRLHIFTLKPNIHVELDDSDVANHIFHVMMQQQMKTMETDVSFKLPKGENVSDSDIDKVINELNGTFFKLEEYLTKFYGITI